MKNTIIAISVTLLLITTFCLFRAEKLFNQYETDTQFMTGLRNFCMERTGYKGFYVKFEDATSTTGVFHCWESYEDALNDDGWIWPNN